MPALVVRGLKWTAVGLTGLGLWSSSDDWAKASKWITIGGGLYMIYTLTKGK